MLFLKNNKLIKISSRWFEENRVLILRSALILTVLSASAILSPKIAMGSRNPILLALVFVALGFFLIFSRWPVLGLIAVMAGGMFVPISFQGGFNLSQIGLAGMLGVWFLDMLVVQRKFQIVRSRPVIVILIFGLTSILSFSLGQFSWYPFARNAPTVAQLGGLVINILSVGGFLLVAHLIDSYHKLELLTWSFIGLGALYIFGRFMEFSWADHYYQLGFTAGSLFWTWLVALVAGQVFANRDLKLEKRIPLVVLLLMIFFVAIKQAYDWKSGWFPPIVSVAVIIAIRYWRKIKYLAILALIPFYFLITASIGQEGWSWGTRLDAWKIVLSIAKVSPILGMGFANYYWYTPLFPIRGYFVKFNSHSQFVDLIAETGLVGLVCFVWFFIEAGLLSLKLTKLAPEGFAKGYIYGALGGLAGTMVAAYLVDWVLPFVYNIGMEGFRASIIGWLFLGGIISIEQIIKRQANKITL